MRLKTSSVRLGPIAAGFFTTLLLAGTAQAFQRQAPRQGQNGLYRAHVAVVRESYAVAAWPRGVRHAPGRHASSSAPARQFSHRSETPV